MELDFDLESLAFLEQTFFDTGYVEGHAHGRIHGLIEGRALGREKGFEIWEELGFYEGFARGWGAILGSGKFKGSESSNERAMQHILHLLHLIDRFPQVNPTSSSPDTEIDLSKLQRQIRSRYKALCSCLGMRPRMQLASGSDENIIAAEPLMEAESDIQIDEQDQDFSQLSTHFESPNRVSPGSAIPVWKIDKESGFKSAVTNMDLSF